MENYKLIWIQFSIWKPNLNACKKKKKKILISVVEIRTSQAKTNAFKMMELCILHRTARSIYILEFTILQIMDKYD